MMLQESSNILTSRQSQQPIEGACPNGGNWYACNNEAGFGFVGCCTVNPCTGVGCAAGNVRAAALGDIPYGSTPDQACQYGGQFFTCLSPEPGFWGCCKTNPCGVGCPQEQLAPASLAQVPNNPFAQSSSGPSTSSSTPTPSRTSNPQVSEVPAQDSGTPTGLIVGVAVGGFIAALLCVALIWYLRRRRRRSKNSGSDVKPAPPMAYAPHSQHPDPASNLPLTSPTYPEAVDNYYVSPMPPKGPFPPTAYPQSPPLPSYNERRISYELGGNQPSGFSSPPPPFPSPGLGGYHDNSQKSRPMSYELVGSPAIGSTAASSAPVTPAMQTVSELPADNDIRPARSTTVSPAPAPAISPAPAPAPRKQRPRPPANPMEDRSATGLGLTTAPPKGGRRKERSSSRPKNPT
ncbi:hypothetical protein ABW19_dt0204047 [Dactylella cylindrospora]|nr:hypothetical protein ABW19_dt0204047 [Dactylella cylindrospora]